MAKGSKRDLWLKNGIKESRKYMKPIMKRRIRKKLDLPDGSYYKKYIGDMAYCRVT